MNIVQITPGAGAMFCGNCFRDNALVGAWRKQGHSTLMVPLYLPLVLDEPDESAGAPLFFGGLNVYLEQRFPFYRKAPAWLRRPLDSPALLRLLGNAAARTRPGEVGALTLSMVRGESGNQTSELDDLIRWLKTQEKPDVICLSNALLLGLARQIRARLDVPIVCLLAGEHAFLDGLAAPFLSQCWNELSTRAAEADLLLAPSRYYADYMENRLELPAGRVQVAALGANLAGYQPAHRLPSDPPVIGFLARMCPEKGLDTLVNAYLILRKKSGLQNLRLKVAGSLGPNDRPFVNSLRRQLRDAGAEKAVEFHPNLSRAEKIAFLQSLTLFSVPALYGEAFGMYLIEAMAVGIPLVQPRHAAFPEILECGQSGLLCEPKVNALAEAIERVLRDRALAAQLGQSGRRAALEIFDAGKSAERMASMFGQILCPTNSK